MEHPWFKSTAPMTAICVEERLRLTSLTLMAQSLMNASSNREQAKNFFLCEQAVFVILALVKLHFIFQKKNFKAFSKMKAKIYYQSSIRAMKALPGISSSPTWVCKVVALCVFLLASPQISLMYTALCSLQKLSSTTSLPRAIYNQGYIAKIYRHRHSIMLDCSLKDGLDEGSNLRF